MLDENRPYTLVYTFDVEGECFSGYCTFETMDAIKDQLPAWWVLLLFIHQRGEPQELGIQLAAVLEADNLLEEGGWTMETLPEDQYDLEVFHEPDKGNVTLFYPEHIKSANVRRAELQAQHAAVEAIRSEWVHQSSPPSERPRSVPPKSVPPSDDFQIILGQRIREARNDNGYTLKDVSETTGINTTLLSKLENGKASVSLEKIQPVLDLLDIAFLG